MKVIQVCPRYYPNIGGIEAILCSVSKRLQGAGLEIEIYSADASSGVVEREVLNGIHVTRFPAISPGDTIYFSLPLYCALKTAKADVIHAHNYRALPMLLAALTKRNGTALVINTHLGFSKLGRWIYHIYDPIFGRRIFDRADKIVISTLAELEEIPLLKDYTHKTVCMPNGIDLSETEGDYLIKRQAKATIDLLYAGRVERKKGISSIIKAVSRLKGLPVSLSIVGDGPYLRTLQGMVDRMGLNTTVTFKGRVAKEGVYSILSTSDIFLLLSEYEAHSVALTEAMSFGVVPIVTRVGGNPYLVNDESGYIVDYPADAEEVAGILKELVNNRELLKKKSREARNYAIAHFDINAMVKRFIEIYEATLAK